MTQHHGRGLLVSLAMLVAAVAHASPGVPAASILDVTREAALDLGNQRDEDCVLSANEAAMLSHLRNAPEQQRPSLRCDAALQAFARTRAEDMIKRGYFGHVTPDRRGPNSLLKRSGYPLPKIYRGVLANNVEAIVAGYADPDRVWQELLASPAHRAHVLAEFPFYARQNEIGIAHVKAPDSEYGDYWVIVTARRADPEEPRLLCMPEPGECFALGNRSTR